MKHRSTLILLAFAAGLGILYYVVILPHSRQQHLIETISQKYFRSDMSALEFIRIRNANGVFDLKKKGQEWAVISPHFLKADSKAVQIILEKIQAGKIRKIVSTDTDRLPEFGLDKPSIILSLGFSGKIDELAFGNKNPAGSGVYVYARGVQAVFLADPGILSDLSVGLSDLRDKTVFRFDPDAIVSIKIDGPRGILDMRKEGAEWRMIRPLDSRANISAIRSFLDAIVGQRAEEVYDGPVPGPETFSKKVLITLGTGEGAVRQLHIYYRGTGSREGVLAYEAGTSHAARLRREFWDLAARDASTFVPRNLLVIDESRIGGIEVTRAASHYRVERKRRGWFVGSQSAPENKIIPFIWFLKDWSAVQIIEPDRINEQKQAEIVITIEDKEGNVTGRVAVYGKVGAAVGYLGNEQVDNLYARSQAISAACLVSSVDLKKIPSKEELLQ